MDVYKKAIYMHIKGVFALWKNMTERIWHNIGTVIIIGNVGNVASSDSAVI